MKKIEKESEEIKWEKKEMKKNLKINEAKLEKRKRRN